MKRSALLSLALLAAGCSSSSSGGGTDVTHVDASGDAKAHGSGDGAVKDAGHDARTVCEPAPVVPDAGSADADSDAEAKDAKAKDAKSDHETADEAGLDAGPVHCTKDTQCPAGDLCDTKSSGSGAGTCVENAPKDGGASLCTAPPEDGGGAPGTCALNADDLCCAPTSGCVTPPATVVVGGGACCPGPAGDTYCQGKLTNDHATCTNNLCTTCQDSCINASPAAYQKFLGYQVADCGCVADGACYAECHTSTTSDPSSACGTCLAAQSTEGLASTCTLAAAADCSNDPQCTAYQACAGACPM